MSKPSVAGGVCLACKFDPDCVYEAASEGVVLQCEQFEMGWRESPARFDFEPHSYQETNAFPGLCSNCDHRGSCIYPKPEGGIWRCDEYA